MKSIVHNYLHAIKSTQLVAASLVVALTTVVSYTYSAAALSCLAAKMIVYRLGDRITVFFPIFMKKKLCHYQNTLKNKEGITASMLFISAMMGVPPYYAINVISGMLRISFNLFITLSFLGFLIRYSLVITFPKLFMNVYSFFTG